jgi:hypothetical protein
MERALKYTLGTLLSIVVLVLALVYGLYFTGARTIPDGWKPTTAVYPASARVALWRSLGGQGDPVADPMSPIGYVWLMVRAVATDRLEFPASAWLASRTSRLSTRFMASGSHGDRHLMEAAATIQASRWPVEKQLDTVLDNTFFAEGMRGFHQGAMHVYGQPLEQLDAAQLHVLMTLDFIPGALCHPDRLRKFAVAKATQWSVPVSPRELDAALAAAHRCEATR